MFHRPLSLACLTGLVLALAAAMFRPPPADGAGAAKPPNTDKPFSVHLVVDVRWEESRECQHDAHHRCSNCQTQGSVHVDITGLLFKNPAGLLFEPLKSPGGAKVKYINRDFCPIDGESSRETADTTVTLRAPTQAASGPANPKEGFLMMIHQPWGMAAQLLGDGRTPVQVPTADLIAHVGQWEYHIDVCVPFETTDSQGHTESKAVDMNLAANLKPEKMTGSMGWDIVANYNDSDCLIHIRVVDAETGRGGRPGNSNNPDDKSKIHYNIGWQIGESLFKTTIVKPPSDKNFVFGKEESDNCVIRAEAQADPASYEDKITPWNIAAVDGSKLEIKKRRGNQELDETPVKGREVLFRFKKLPAKNDSFGPKTITAKDADPVDVKVFFKKKGKDNPEGGDTVNWYYYWKQGVVADLEKFTYNDSLPLAGQFSKPNKLEMGKYGAEKDGPYDIRLTMRSRTSKEDVADLASRHTAPSYNLGPYKKSSRSGAVVTIHWPVTKGIDTCNVSVVHELFHKWIYDNWTSNAEWDTDRDGVPDWAEKMLEGSLGLDYQLPDTHNLAAQLGSAQYSTYGDEELLCRLKELGLHLDGKNDWSSPGRQSTPPE